MFVGREEELDNLEKQFSSDSRTAALVYGKRRVGKSTLVAQVAKAFDGAVVEHLCAQSSFEGNLELLCRSVSGSLELPAMRSDYLQDLFGFLNGLERRILLVIDEYQYLKQSRAGNEVDSLFQAIIDSLSPNVELVPCGSLVIVMRELLEEANPLFALASWALEKPWNGYGYGYGCGCGCGYGYGCGLAHAPCNECPAPSWAWRPAIPLAEAANVRPVGYGIIEPFASCEEVCREHGRRQP